ncbi:hypothetical protein Tco_1576283 [Tanacetum coccineum]
MIVMTFMIELESLFGHLFDEYSNGLNQGISKSSVVTAADASDKHQQQPDSTSSTSTLATTVTTDGNFDLSYALSWKPCQGDSLNLPDHRYLGVSVGAQMSRNSAWANTIQKLHSRLSRWKEKVLASKKNGGLGVSSFHALNRALLLKWVWRFLSQDGSIWSCVISAIYGPSLEHHQVNHSSSWCSILRETRFPRVFALEEDKEVSVTSKLGSSSVDSSFRRLIQDGIERQQWSDLSSLLESVILSPSKDRWFCDLNGEGAFHVKDARSIIDDIFLPSSEVATSLVVWLSWNLLYVPCAAWLQKMLPMSYLDVSYLSMFSVGFAGGGILIGKTFRPFLIGMVGSLMSGCRTSLSSYWKAFFVPPGGIFGFLGITLFLTRPLRDALFFLMILSRGVSLGVVVDVILCFLRIVG